MLNQTLPADLPATIQLTGFICQICTTLIAAVIGLVTFRYTRRQNALTLINQNNSLANLVNSTILQSEQAGQTLGKLHSFVVGCPDDAILFMYLNYIRPQHVQNPPDRRRQRSRLAGHVGELRHHDGASAE